MPLLYAIIFVSGGAILALELLASRIMTPYFGVSLYIWTGILSITLVSLALGYWLGGRWAGRGDRLLGLDRLAQLYALMPAVAALAIVAACLAYPFLFSSLAGWSLLFGAFVACLILLFLPLVATSAMNPLLVAIALRSAERRTGDAGAGKVFFVSTIGSVAGVLVTAFGMIPHLSNFTATLAVALTLALLSLGMASIPAIRLAARNAVVATALAAALASILLLWQADAYTGRTDAVAYAGRTWRVEATHGSLFGTVKILRSSPDADSDRFLRIYFQDGLTQNTVDSGGRSMSFYTYALEALAYAYHPEPRSALVLGLGAGIVPMRLARRGVDVAVVEIDPASLRVAREFFGFDAARARVHHADARTFLRRCPRAFDVVVIDLFHGDGTPDYLVTREFFRDLKRCLSPRGIAVFNTFADLERPAAYAHFLATLRAELPHIVLHRPDWPGAVHVNSFVVAGSDALAAPARVTIDRVPARHGDTLWNMLASPRPLDAALLAGGRIVTDARNVAAHDLALSQLIYRQAVVEALPHKLLLN
ncbi:MAG: fused MFS/spermidine synthase [Betaproteobacteria bacterium]|nr:fused MFS/spermidine synthase [Betaproteobacteria bacterium]